MTNKLNNILYWCAFIYYKFKFRLLQIKGKIYKEVLTIDTHLTIVIVGIFWVSYSRKYFTNILLIS